MLADDNSTAMPATSELFLESYVEYADSTWRSVTAAVTEVFELLLLLLQQLECGLQSLQVTLRALSASRIVTQFVKEAKATAAAAAGCSDPSSCLAGY